MELVTALTIVLAAALIGGFVAQRLGQPLIVGYIVAGVVVGPLTGGFAVAHVQDIEALAELGVALLLFSLGLEVSFHDLTPVRAVALGGAAVQIVLTMAVGAGLADALGWRWQPALWFGALIALSSTMVALKTLQAQGRLGTLSSRVMLGMLVVQDLAVVPLMIVLPELSNPAGGPARVIAAIGRSLVLLVVTVLVATRLVPRVMASVARWNSRELFLLATTTVALGVGFTAWSFGLSLALGAFIAGLVINESEYAHQALSDVIPLRDVFGTLFFVSVGMLLDPALVWRHFGTFVAVGAVVGVAKALIIGGVVRAFGYRRVIPLASGLTLFQVGEFAFVLARVGLAAGAITNDMYALVLNTAVMTMALTPIVSGLTPWIYERVVGQRTPEPLQALNLPDAGVADHVIVAGAGRVGRTIADALAQLTLPCVLVELDDRRVQQARAAGLAIVYGDASHAVVLDAAGLSRARALLVTVPTYPDVRAIVRSARRVRPDLAIVARAEGPQAVQDLYALGIEEVTSPEFEAAIEMTRVALMHLNLAPHEILQVASDIRRARYGGTTQPADSRTAITREVTRQLDFAWIALPPHSPFDGRTIGELQVRTRLGAAVVAVIHAGSLSANPDAHAPLAAGDLVAVLGTREQIARFELAADPAPPEGR
ncbi:MAG: cation:proton antiporter [Betaproteobacteria bacterium]